MFSILRPGNPIARRLYPLYIAAFLQGFVFWYAIEKAFMLEVGFTYATIGLMAAAYSLMMLVIETPSGILADRWSRKGVLMVASISLALSSLICGLSGSVGMYIVGAAFWGIFYAFYSGTYDSIIYDTLLEEHGKADNYAGYYGWVRVFDGAGLILSALLGGLLAAGFGLDASYLWAIPINILSLVALALFREPKLHKAEAPEPLLRHIGTTFGAVLQRGSLIIIVAVLILGGLISEMVGEFNQLWWIAIATPIALFGPANVPILGSYGISGLLAPWLKLQSRAFVAAMCAVLLAAGSALLWSRNLWMLVAAQAILLVTLLAISTAFLGRLHDRLPSKVRAGASSAVNTLIRILFVAGSLGFGWLSNHTSVFSASWIIVIPLAGLCIVLFALAKNTGVHETQAGKSPALR